MACAGGVWATSGGVSIELVDTARVWPANSTVAQSSCAEKAPLSKKNVNDVILGPLYGFLRNQRSGVYCSARAIHPRVSRNQVS